MADTLCKGCGREEQFYAPIGLCPRCRRRVRDTAKELAMLLHCIARDEVLDLLGRLAYYAHTLHDGTAARFMERTSVPVSDFPDGWDLSSEVH